MATFMFTRVLDPATQGRRSLDVTADSLDGALKEMVRQMPAVEVHLFDHTGVLRPHVLCFVDGESTRLEDRSRPIGPNSKIRFLQAVSGG